MAKINMRELLADREKGTDGPWETAQEPRADLRTSWSWIGTSDWRTRVARVVEYSTQEHEMRVNARRIARLPDLEAAYIEAVELLKDIGGEGWLNAAHYERARNFLGDIDCHQ